MTSFTESKGFWIALAVAVVVSISAVLVWRAVSDDSMTRSASSAPPNLPINGEASDSTTPPAMEGPGVAKKTTPSTDSGSTSTNEDFGACTEDAKVYCSGFYGSDWEAWATANGYTTASWKLGLVDCLGQNRDKTSEACHESMDRRAGLNEDVNTLCAADRATYCAGVEPKPGSEPQVDCLKENYDNLTAECAAAVDAHEAAKPADQQDTY